MLLLDTLNLFEAILGVLALFVYLPYFLPRTSIPHVAVALREALQEIERAEEMGAIPFPSLARRTLERYGHVSYFAMRGVTSPVDSLIYEFRLTRIASNRSPGILRQLVLVGLTFKLCSLRSQIEVIRTDVEVRWNGFLCCSPTDKRRCRLSWL
jgi:hypothetical protein